MANKRAPEPLSFRPSARLQRYLGRELISDPNLAVIEFVKNAYDAGATEVLIEFELDASPDRLVIADNGSGMTEVEFRDNWMHPGFSHKAADAPPAPVAAGPGSRSQARQLQRVRIPAGEKGLGRMAAGRLGDSMDVYTRPSSALPWFHVRFVWSEFEDMTLAMDEVRVKPDLDSAPPRGFDQGTVVVIEGLSQKWDGRVRGRPVRGRKRTKLGRLRQDLEYFVRPLSGNVGDFRIDLESDRAAEAEDLGPITRVTAADAAEYAYSFEFFAKNGQAVVARKVSRGEEVAESANALREEDFPPVPVKVDDADDGEVPAPLQCGPFRGTFYYSPPPASSRATESLPMGVLLFRDGVWVEPYGIDEDDWLGVAARKAQRQGHAAIQPNTMTGHVEISRQHNPELHDMSNRMGLLENEESEEFLYLVRQEFRHFERMVYEEVLEPRWKGNKAKEAVRKARGEVDAASVFMRSLAHSVRQPLEGLQVEMGTLQELVRRSDIPEATRDALVSLAQRAEEHTTNAAQFVEQALRFDVPDFRQLPVSEILDSVEVDCRASARSRGVELTFEGPRSRSEIVVPAELVIMALESVVENAIRAPRAEGVSPQVSVMAAAVDTACMVVVRDNGTGIADYRAGQSLASIRSTSGRPGVGLKLAELGARASQGRLEVLASGPEGTVMAFTLPTRASGLEF